MRVELSSWEKADLTIPCRAKRRSHQGQLVALSFVEPPSSSSARRSNKRSRRSLAGYDGPDTPSLVVTSEDKIVVVVKKEGSDPAFVESPVMQYQARPGTSFFSNNKHLPKISAIFDSKHDRFYALQKDNKRLLSWAYGSSVDDASQTNMSSAVLSMSSLSYENQSLVFGTMENNSLFVSDGVDKVIESSAPSLLKGLKHVATVAEQNRNDTEADNKRPMPSSSRFSFYQIFADKRQLILVRHSISDSFESTGFKAEQKVIALEKHGISSKDVWSAYLIGNNKAERSVFVGLQSGTDTHVAGLSLATGSLLRKTFNLASQSNNVCLTKGSIVVECVNNQLLLVDANRGVRLGMQALDGTSPVVAHAANGARLVLVRESGSNLALSLCSVVSSPVLRLADALGMVQGIGPIGPQNIVSGTLKDVSPVQNAVHADVADASAKLETADLFVRKSGKDKLPENFLLNSFNEAVRIASSSALVLDKSCKMGLNGTSKLNGTNHNVLKNSSPGKVKNGKKAKTIDDLPSLEDVPSVFINEAARRMADILTAPELEEKSSVLRDAGSILKSLVRTKRVDSRNFLWGNGQRNGFQKLLSSMDTENGAVKAGYTAMEFSFDLLRCCNDVTESQIIGTLHFLFASGSPVNFASFLLGVEEVEERLTEACDKFLSISKQGEASKSAEWKKLSSRMTIASTTLYLKKIFSYSDLNGALLRRGVASTLSRNEIALLLSLLQQFLLSYNDSTITRRIVDLASALCDCLCAFKKLTKTESSALLSLQRQLDREAKVADSLTSLQVLVDEVWATGDADDETLSDLQATYEIEILALD